MKFEALVEFFEVSFTDLSEVELDGVSSEELTISVYVSFTDLSEGELDGVSSEELTISVYVSFTDLSEV